MGSHHLDERRNALEVATYANSMRVALRRCGVFQRAKTDKAVGLTLPRDADFEVYRAAVSLILRESGILRYAVSSVHASARGSTDCSDALKALSQSSSVIVLIAHDAVVSDDLRVSLDHLVEVGRVKPYHLVLAAKTVLGMMITRDEVAKLFQHPLPLILAAFRQKRPIEVTLQKLAELPQRSEGNKWEPRIENLAGYGKAADWALELADDISAWRHGSIDWSDVDSGLLLSGPPGGGKTLFASAVARSCGAAFFAASSGQWQAQGHLGDMLRAMRKSFRDAIAAAPSILFIDEFDSFGSRANLRGDNAAYGLQVINGLLELLDGAAGREGVVVIAATNRPSDIDEALLRPGRLDRHIRIPLPDLAAREQILRTHSKANLTSEELQPVASATSGYSGAALRQLARDARRIARKERRDLRGSDFMTIVPPLAALTDSERWTASIHEAGHAVVGLELGVGEIEAIVVARQAAHRDDSFAHVLWQRPVMRNRPLQSYLNEIAMLLGGMAAESVILEEIHDGFGGIEGSDLHRATDIATILVAGHGVGELCYYSIRGPGDLEEIRRSDHSVRQRVASLLLEELNRAKGIVQSRRDDLLLVSEAVLVRELLPGVEVAKLILAASTTRSEMET
ncbi:AAA family ATPase [Rhizobium leguminosarum]|uniref:AAA family ATPase n=1 Tax=Rhizobium leguminosarum TaxID=384 RepID=UPI001C98E480|nr:AAA family ATPase [Rhizobium leguminosarum]MBY5439069.1 AAA family ATPase [Rhizobium leguminosarum]